MPPKPLFPSSSAPRNVQAFPKATSRDFYGSPLASIPPDATVPPRQPLPPWTPIQRIPSSSRKALSKRNVRAKKSAAELDEIRKKEVIRMRALRAARSSEEAAATRVQDAAQHRFLYNARLMEERLKHVYSEEELADMDASLAFGLKSSQEEIYTKCADQLSLNAMTKHCCVVCDCNYAKSELVYRSAAAENMNFRRVLHVDKSIRDALDPLLVSQYDVSGFDVKLANLFLSPNGFYYKSNELHHPVRVAASELQFEQRPGQFVSIPREKLLVVICPDCFEGTRRRSADSSDSEGEEATFQRMPVEAIANGNWIGRLPSSFGDISRTTENVVSLMQPCLFLSTMFGSTSDNGRKTIKSHHYVLKNSEPVLRQVPADIGATFRFSFVGAWTPPEIAETRARYKPQDCMHELLEFLETHHKGYISNKEYIRERSSCSEEPLTDVFVDRSLSGDAPVNERLCRLMQHSAYNTGTAEVAAEESTVHYVFSPVSDEVTVSAPPSNSQSSTTSHDYAVFNSTNLSKAKNLANIGLYFPSLLAFGEGGPTAERQVHMSVKRWVKRCFKLHGGQFARHWGFTAIAYDYIAMDQSFSQQYLSMRVRKSAISDGSWTKEDIQKCYSHSREVESCLKRGVNLPPAPPEVKRLLDLKKRVLPGLRAFVGSDESRQSGLHTAFGLQKRLGSPHMFATISPATSRSWAIAINCDLVNGEHCELKFTVGDEWTALVLPNNNARAAAAGDNAYECADYARRILKVFLADFIGWDEKFQAPVRGGGMLGVPRYVTTSAETQKLGDIHFHMIISMHGLPSTSDEILFLRKGTIQ
ncbi:hypothetical protein BDR26DRAFT_963681 [Obelidium mucronatum]|nr:hypothetical protein BDR26DRAFT_963681 [Obelidium mucronatum]